MTTIDLYSATFRDQVYGCWLGKNCGGTLGAPLERAWGEPEPFDIWWYPELKEGGIPNDDLEMQLLWLKALEEVGPGLKAADLAQYWLDHIGYNWDEYGLSKTNLRLGLLPPVSGAFNNWFKDCMGCPIRSEIWACVAPGMPRIAVRYAFEDAICDHAGGESVFGEMFNAAVESAAFVISDREQLIEIGMSYVPAGSKTAQAIRAALTAHADGVDWKEARRRVLAATPHYNAQYSPINLAFQVIGWLYGEEFGDALCKAVNCGYDTDCTGATLGSILGIIATRTGLPQRWTEPLGENISTNESWGGIRHASTGPNPVPKTLDELTERVCRMAQRVLTAQGVLDGGATFTVDPATLYADSDVAALWHANPMRIDSREGTLAVGVDYGDTPAIAAGAVKTFTTYLTNPHPVEIRARCTMQAPPGWQVAEQTRTVAVPPHASVGVEWKVTAPPPALLENSNTLYLQVAADERSAQPAVPVVLIGARRFRAAGPYLIAGAEDVALCAHSFAPEQGTGSTPDGRLAEWRDGYALDNALPLQDLLAGGGAVYVQTFLWCPAERTAVVGVPASCPRKLWLNGELVVERANYRPARPNYNGDGQSYATVTLLAGWNEILLKFVRTPGAAPFEGHLIACTADDLRAGLVEVGWTRLPWDVGVMSTSSAMPPVAKTAPYTFTHLGYEFQDPYAWLQNKEDPEVLAYLAAENEYTHEVMKHTGALQEELFAEMRGRLQEDERSAPERRGPYLYYWRMEPGKQYRIFCRKALADDATEEILVDENELAEGHSYCKVRIVDPCPDHSLVAYAVDFTGAWVWELYVKDLRTGQLLSGPIANTAYSSAWANDNRSLFYTVFDHAHRADKVFCHTVGQDSSQDRAVYHEPDEAFGLHLQRARSGAYLVLTIASNSASEVRYLRADQPEGSFALVAARRPWIEYYVEPHGDRFWIFTNAEAENFRLMAAPADAPGRENWREVLPHRADTLLEEVHGFDDFLVLVERRGGLTQLRISAPDAVTNVRYVTFPDAAYMVALTANPEASSQVLRFQYSSMVTPDRVVDYDVRDGAWDVVKQLQIPSGYDASQYTSERIFATSHDGALAPISLVYRKGMQRDGSNPLLLYGYGSYGYSQEASFQTNRLSLLDRGFIYAVAHIRGGSEMGRAWYDQGRLLHKKNTFHDFIACAEHLIAQGYTRPQKVAIMGGSAGGLLVAAVTNLRPDLFKAVVALVPFTNVITAILTPDLPLTVTEYDQWGHPDDPAAFDYMLSYSPYENVARKAYPHILARAGLNDLQVPYWDPAKWVAKLRSCKTDPNRLLLLTNMAAGHGGASGRYDYLREVAENYAFVIDTVL